MGSRISGALGAACLALAAAVPCFAGLVPAIHDYEAGSLALPGLLSETGLYRDIALKSRAVTPGIHPFSVNSPLWSDGSAKERFVALPPGTRVTPTDSDGWVFPDKAVMIKNFSIDTVYGDSATRVLVETRFLVRRESVDGFGVRRERYLGFTYAWNKDQGDARLVPPDSARLEVVRIVRMQGRLVGKRWLFPSQGDCTACHSGRRRFLGFFTQQLDRTLPGGKNQLQDLKDKGVLAANPVAGKAKPHRWHGLKDTAGTREQRVRSYFGSNCSHCHGNSNNTALHILDYLNPLQDIRHSDANPGGYVGRPGGDGMQIAPGRPDSSYFLEKMVTRPEELALIGTASMPPLATFQIDSGAVDLVRRWVCELGGVEPASPGCRLPRGTPDASTWAASLFRRRHGGVSGFEGLAGKGWEFRDGGMLFREPVGAGREAHDAVGRRAGERLYRREVKVKNEK